MPPDALGARLAGFALIALLGALLPRWRRGLFDPAVAGPILATLVTDLTYPALTLSLLARAPVPRSALQAVVPATVALAGGLGLAWALSAALGLDRPARGAFVLAAGFSNTAFVGLPLTQALFPAPGHAAAAIVIDTVDTTLLLWTAGIAIARHFGEGARPGPAFHRAWLRPPTLAVVLGLSFGGLGVTLPRWLDATLETLGAATTPLVFLFIGLRLDARDVVARRGPLAALALVKLVAMPLAAALSARALGLRGSAASVATLQSAMPTALVAVVIAAREGCDPRLATAAVAVTVPLGVALTVLSAPLLRWLDR